MGNYFTGEHINRKEYSRIDGANGEDGENGENRTAGENRATGENRTAGENRADGENRAGRENEENGENKPSETGGKISDKKTVNNNMLSYLLNCE